jgi:hypothetical protein
VNDIGYLLGQLFGALILNILLSTIAKWLLKKTKLSYTNKNLIASSLTPVLSLLINPSLFLIYFAVAIPVFFVHQQADKKTNKEHSTNPQTKE